MQQDATTDKNGLRRLNGKYMIAVSTYYASKCGEELIVVLEDGSQFEAIVGDIKQNLHTNSTNQYTPINSNYGNVVEFIVDKTSLYKKARISGDISDIGLQGNIAKILKIIKE